MKKIILVCLILLVCGCSSNKKEEVKVDNEDLTCVRENNFGTFIDVEKIVFKFDEVGKIANYIEIREFVYPSIEEAKDYYDKFKEYNKLELDGTSVISKSEIVVTKENNYYNKTRKEMKNIYLNELFYDKCS